MTWWTECYFGTPGYCSGELWQCETCKEWFCEAHFHNTDLGHNVECVGCEYTRRRKERTSSCENILVMESMRVCTIQNLSRGDT